MWAWGLSYRQTLIGAWAWSDLAVGSEPTFRLDICKYLIGSFFIMAFIPFRPYVNHNIKTTSSFWPLSYLVATVFLLA